jgi:hypothetical protein
MVHRTALSLAWVVFIAGAINVHQTVNLHSDLIKVGGA